MGLGVHVTQIRAPLLPHLIYKIFVISVMIMVGLRADFLVHFMARALQPEEAEETESEVSRIKSPN